jgi:hypothetical protein
MFKSVASLLFGGCLFALSAMTPPIGTVRSDGHFRVDGNAIRGNATLFEGSLIETISGRSVVELSGAQITLLPDSRARVYHDRTLLEKGVTVMRDGEKCFVEAANLHISSPGKDALLQVEMFGRNHVAVTSRVGLAEVRNETGTLIARVRAGLALAFDPQAAAPTAVTLSGTVEAKDGSYFLTDVTTNVTSELRGPDLAKYVGKKVQVTGSTTPTAPNTGASQGVQVATVGRMGAAAAAGAGAATTSVSTVGAVAIVGGVAAVGTVVGLGVAGVFHADSTASRQ